METYTRQQAFLSSSSHTPNLSCKLREAGHANMYGQLCVNARQKVPLLLFQWTRVLINTKYKHVYLHISMYSKNIKPKHS